MPNSKYRDDGGGLGIEDGGLRFAKETFLCC
jgi:hypothetical protein